jgi:VWFA-related protein
MPRTFPCFVLLLAACALGQTPSAKTPSAPIETLKASAQLVVVDVVVTGKDHKPIHGLHASDFVLTEDKLPQAIKHFEEHTALTRDEAAKLPPMPKMLPGYFTNYTPAPPGGTVNVLLLDALNTPMNAQAYVREQLLDYLKKAPTGAPVAIFGLTDRLTILQAFTSDPAILKAAVTTVARPEMSGLLDDPLTGSNSESITDFMGGMPGGKPGQASTGANSQILANVQQFEANHASFQFQLRAQYTLQAMNILARYLESIPGRKNLIWFSGSFPINVLPDGDLPDPFSVVASAEREYRETTNLLTRAQVAVYPIDARGILTSAVHAASSPAKGYAHNPHAFAKDQSRFFEELFAEHETMTQMAQDTGGRAFVDTDGLTAAVGQAIESGANYYTLSYTPTDTRWNGKFRKIQLKLASDSDRVTDRSSATLTYRRGYYADDPNAPPAPARESAATAPAHASPMEVAMLRGAPTPTEILLKVRILPASAATEPAIAEGNALNPDRKVGGPFRRLLIDFEADPGVIRFTITPDGNSHCSLEFITFVYDRDGTMIDAIDTPVRSNFTPAKYQAILHSGVPFHQEVSVPVKGEFFLRSAVRDTQTGRVGAIEVPVASVTHLPPAR